MKEAGSDITSYFGPPRKRSNFFHDTSEAQVQVRSDVSPAIASSAAEDSILDIASFFSGGASSDSCKLKLI